MTEVRHASGIEAKTAPLQRAEVGLPSFPSARAMEQLTRAHEVQDRRAIQNVRGQIAAESNREQAATRHDYFYQIPETAVLKYKGLSSRELRQGIDQGTFTDTDAVRISYLKSIDEDHNLALERSRLHPDLREGEMRRHELLVQELTPLIYGSPDKLAKALADEAKMAETWNAPATDDYGHPSETNQQLMAESRVEALHLRAMQRRFEQQARKQGISLEKEEQQREQNQLTAEQQRDIPLASQHETTKEHEGNQHPSQLKRSQEEPNQTFGLTTAEGNTYTLNLPTNASLADIQTALRTQGAHRLAQYIERNVYAPSTVNMDYLQEVVQTFSKRSVREMHRSEGRRNFMQTYTFRGETNGKQFTVTLPKDHTAQELVEALRAQGEYEIGKDGFYLHPGEANFTEAVQNLLRADLGDIAGLLKDIWKAIKKGQKEYENYQKYAASTK